MRVYHCRTDVDVALAQCIFQRALGSWRSGGEFQRPAEVIDQRLGGRDDVTLADPQRPSSLPQLMES
ncbi:hypothetical protein AAFF_G00408650 [Aldrovandia affinis]|uniref:Uncharacterized protein n=1 Tax=Aldrovandia affinis TaxID=143900 RepID=A0AAD7SC35_9TELE|nr:hypothetical protein AAFF_G00408650 [Aldrovandia affinis]